MELERERLGEGPNTGRHFLPPSPLILCLRVCFHPCSVISASATLRAQRIVALPPHILPYISGYLRYLCIQHPQEGEHLDASLIEISKRFQIYSDISAPPLTVKAAEV